MSADLEDTLTAEPAVPFTASAELDVEPTIETGQLKLPEPAAVAPPEEPPVPSGPRESYYAFRIGSSAVVLLDAIAYIGRKPTLPRVVRGGRPRLVRVSSPTNEVSSTHLELRQSGTTIVVQDLNSTNGTSVAVPGFGVRALRSGESLVVGVGTTIDIGDRNVIEILPLQEKPLQEKPVPGKPVQEKQ